MDNNNGVKSRYHTCTHPKSHCHSLQYSHNDVVSGPQPPSPFFVRRHKALSMGCIEEDRAAPRCRELRIQVQEGKDHGRRVTVTFVEGIEAVVAQCSQLRGRRAPIAIQPSVDAVEAKHAKQDAPAHRRHQAAHGQPSDAPALAREQLGGARITTPSGGVY